MALKYVSADDEGDYENIAYSVADRTELVFGVSACKEVRIALSEIPGITTRNTYELCIGEFENSMTILKDAFSGQSLVEAYTTEILNCSGTRMFWVSWAVGTLSFGRGTTVQQNRLLYFKDANAHHVNAVSVKTPVGVVGNFTFEHFGGKYNGSLI
jgi:hypothetical protein